MEKVNPNDRFGLKAESNMDIFEKDLSGANGFA